MPTSTDPSSATDTDLTMPRSVIGRWISGSETVASAALTASTSGFVISPPAYVHAGASGRAEGALGRCSERGTSERCVPSSGGRPERPLRGPAGAAADQGHEAVLEHAGLDRAMQHVVSAGVARLGLELLVGTAGEHH